MRPRFKEFALGHPLMLLGLWLQAMNFKLQKGGRYDGRPWMVLGMVGQVSIVNTFCHLHSPLSLAFFRTFNGVILGLFIGFILIQGTSVVVRGENT